MFDPWLHYHTCAKESRRWRRSSLHNAESVRRAGAWRSSTLGDRPLHVSYSPSDGRKFVAVVEFELKTALVRSAADATINAASKMQQHDCDALTDWSYSTHTAIERHSLIRRRFNASWVACEAVKAAKT